MNLEDWKTYWRTCHMTPFQIETLERLYIRLEGLNAMPSGDDITITSVCDAMELQMMGIKP